MISRRMFVAGSAALVTAAATGTAQASSILEMLFDGDRQVIYEAPERDLPAPIDQPRIKKKVKKVSTVNSKKKAGKSYKIDPIYEPQEVEYYDGQAPGTIVINSEDKFLFLVEEGNRARRYGVAIGKEGDVGPPELRSDRQLQPGHELRHERVGEVRRRGVGVFRT